MKTLSRRSGFSLVELLTVIAIIAILAAIIFPVMSLVKDRARQNQCMTNIKQIGMALNLFKTDNRCYPAALVPAVQDPDAAPGTYLPFDRAKSAAGLYPEYLKGGFTIFHCPTSKDTDKTVVIPTIVGHPGHVYQYNSYEGIVFKGVFEQHYTLEWAAKVSDVASITADPADGKPNPDAVDYERQLKFRNPPEDTVVTWCSWHEVRDATPGAPPRGKAIVLFLGGEAATIDAAKIEKSLWRVKQQ